MKYLFEKSILNEDGTVTIPAWAVERWTRQCITPYATLPEQEKASDRAEADKMLAIVAATRGLRCICGGEPHVSHCPACTDPFLKVLI